MASDAAEHTTRDDEALSGIDDWISEIEATPDRRSAQIARRLRSAHQQMTRHIADLERQVEQLQFGRIGGERLLSEPSSPLRDHPSCPCPAGSTCASLCCPRRSAGF